MVYNVSAYATPGTNGTGTMCAEREQCSESPMSYTPCCRMYRKAFAIAKKPRIVRFSTIQDQGFLVVVQVKNLRSSVLIYQHRDGIFPNQLE